MYLLDLFTFLHPVKPAQASLISQHPPHQAPCLLSFLFTAARMIFLNTDRFCHSSPLKSLCMLPFCQGTLLISHPSPLPTSLLHLVEFSLPWKSQFRCHLCQEAFLDFLRLDSLLSIRYGTFSKPKVLLIISHLVVSLSPPQFLGALLNPGFFRTVPVSYFVDIVSLNALGLCMPLMFREEDVPLYNCINDTF